MFRKLIVVSAVAVLSLAVVGGCGGKKTTAAPSPAPSVEESSSQSSSEDPAPSYDSDASSTESESPAEEPTEE